MLNYNIIKHNIIKRNLQQRCRRARRSWSRPRRKTISGLVWTLDIRSFPDVANHRPQSSSFLGLPYRILNINHRKELLRDLWVTKEQL